MAATTVAAAAMGEAAAEVRAVRPHVSYDCTLAGRIG